MNNEIQEVLSFIPHEVGNKPMRDSSYYLKSYKMNS